MKIKSLKFKNGPTISEPFLSINQGVLTILVGPNFSGKSQTLKEIYESATTQNPAMEVLDSVSRSFENFDSYRERFEVLKFHESGDINAWKVPVVSTIKENADISFNIRHLETYCEQAKGAAENQVTALAKASISAMIGRYFCVILDGATRLNLVKPQSRGSLQRPPQNHFQTLFLDDDLRAKFRNAIHDRIRIVSSN